MRAAFLLLTLVVACDRHDEIPPPILLPTKAPPAPVVPADAPTAPIAEATRGPCAVVTVKDVTDLVGAPAGAPTADELSCTYQVGSDTVVGLVSRQGGDQMWDSFKQTADTASAVPIAIPGGKGWRVPGLAMFALAMHDSFVMVTATAQVSNERVESVMKQIAARL